MKYEKPEMVDFGTVMAITRGGGGCSLDSYAFMTEDGVAFRGGACLPKLSLGRLRFRRRRS